MQAWQSTSRESAERLTAAQEGFRLGAEPLHATILNEMWCLPWNELHGDDPVEAL
jgi:hypothetical protein